jgi:acylpyruvate hydrolase
MRLVTIDAVGGGTPGAILASGEILDLRRAAREGTAEVWIPGSVRQILEAGEGGLAVVRALVDSVERADSAQLDVLRSKNVVASHNTVLLAPVPDPRLVVAAGLAYKSHLAEMAGTPTPRQPTGFMKTPHSIAGSGVVHLPPDAPDRVDYEGELAVVFGKTCHKVGADEALDYVAGYMAANDFSARDWVEDVWKAEKPWDARTTWEINIMGKQFEGFTSTGPALLTADEIKHPGAFSITTRINGKTMQSASVSDLIFDLGQTISYFSKWYVFRPGDILLTGTPAGVGVGRNPPVFLREGDLVEVEIAEIGVLRSRIALRR